MHLDQASAELSSSPLIPRRALVIIALAPLVPLGALLIYLGLGVVPNPHGTGALLLILIAVASAIAVLFECVLVPMSVLRLLRNPSLRTTPNIASVAFGAIFIIVVALFAWHFR